MGGHYMFKNNSKRKRLSDLLIPGIIFAVIGAVFAFQGIRDYNNLNGDLLNLNTASVSDLADGKYVEINVEYANYSFCENVETTNYVFKRTTEQYYLINALENNDYYLGLNVAESKKDDLKNYRTIPGIIQIPIRDHCTIPESYANQTMKSWVI